MPQQYRTGRAPSRTEIPRLKFRNYLTGPLPTPPPECDYSAPAMRTMRNVYLNDQYGDCVIAGYAHVRGVTSANAGAEVVFSPADILKMYHAIGGPGDNGCMEDEALNYWLRTGATDGSRLAGWLSLDPSKPQEYKAACWLFENLYFGIQCPNHWFNPMPQGDGYVWDVAGPNVPQNGHCVVGYGYDARGVKMNTWGKLGLITDAAIAEYCTRQAGGELYVLLSPDMIAKGQQRAPNGLSWHDLVSDFNALGGSLPVPPDLTPQLIDWGAM